jgi:hypothetical protein
MSTITFRSGRDAGGLWAITSYFNPIGYRRRPANYRLFRERLNVPLVTVELAYGSDFELTQRDADILVQLRGADILWQKERLLNVALRHLPSTCQKIAALDCDVIFELADWGERVEDLLDRFMLVQMFSRVHSMPRDWIPGEAATEPEHTRPSAAAIISSGVAPAICLRDRVGARGRGSPGYAWAARRELFEQNGIYDTCILGGGVSALISAAYGCFDHVMQIHNMNDLQKRHYMAWAQPFCDMIRADTGFLDCNLFHLWHGESGNRRYLERHQGFGRFHYNPLEDVAIDDNGCWRWNSNKPEMHEYVRKYLASRKEDG